MRLISPSVLAVLAVLSSPALAAPLDDSAILSIFDQANMTDITIARLGLKKAADPAVRDLARMVLADHEAVQRMGRDLGKAQAIVAMPPDGDGAVAAAATAYAMLQSKAGAEFDRSYLEHEIAFHQGVIDAIRTTLLPAIANPALRELVLKVLPGFEHHLAETRRVAERLGVR